MDFVGNQTRTHIYFWLSPLRQSAAKGRQVLYIWDRAGIDFRQWFKWKKNGIYFLSREKENMKLVIVGIHPFDRANPINQGVISDEMVTTNVGVTVRRVTYQDPATGIIYAYLTNPLALLGPQAESFRQRFGHYPASIHADKIYQTRANRAWCKERDIRLSGKPLGRPRAMTKEEKKRQRQDKKDRNPHRRQVWQPQTQRNPATSDGQTSDHQQNRGHHRPDRIESRPMVEVFASLIQEILIRLITSTRTPVSTTSTRGLWPVFHGSRPAPPLDPSRGTCFWSVRAGCGSCGLICASAARVSSCACRIYNRALCKFLAS